MMICRPWLIVLVFLLEHMVLGGFNTDKELKDQDLYWRASLPTVLRVEVGCCGSYLCPQLCRAEAGWLLEPQTDFCKKPGECILSVYGERRLCDAQQHCGCCSYTSYKTNKSTPRISLRKWYIDSVPALGRQR